MDNVRRQIELELEFSTLIRQLPVPQKQALMMRILDARGQPPPIRDWRVVQPTGGAKRI
jgi:hypothetical protein